MKGRKWNRLEGVRTAPESPPIIAGVGEMNVDDSDTTVEGVVRFDALSVDQLGEMMTTNDDDDDDDEPMEQDDEPMEQVD